MPRIPKATPQDVLCDLLRETRAARGMTQTALAEAIGFMQTDVSKVERGARRLDVLELRAWALALGVSLPAFTDELEGRLSNLEALRPVGRSKLTRST